MLDIAPTELLLVALVALVVIGPKDLPRVMRVVGSWVGRARGVARQFRSGFDEMVRQSELDEMEKKWAAENERIMREHPIDPAGDGTWQPVARDTGRPGAVADGAADADHGGVDAAGGAAMTPLAAAPAEEVAGDASEARGSEPEPGGEARRRP